MGKHAFLILAHKDNVNFRQLISMLDHERNDIYIHMDKKNKGYKEQKIVNLAKHSNVYHIKRIEVNWGGFSIVKAELRLLKKAINNEKYDYCHLLSGDDLPIKTNKYIHDFFDEHLGNEFVGIKKDVKYRYRVSRFYFFQEKIGRETKVKSNRYVKLDRYCELLFRKIKYLRNKSVDLWYGTQWFSITDDFARYVLSKKGWIYYHFKYTYIPDELFLQTVLAKSPFFDRVFNYESNSAIKPTMRYIDWVRGRPYVFREEDFDDLMSTEMLFARKFNSDVNPNLTYRISETLKTNYDA